MRVVVAVVAMFGAGCGSSPEPSDVGGADATTITPVEVTPPDIPWLASGVPPVSLTPCPTGWLEVTAADGVMGCEPYPADGPTPCPAGEVWFPGKAACAPLGFACPADGRVADLPTDRPVVHVLAGVSGGDGSFAAPYGALDSFSWARLPAGAVVAAGVGVYEGEVRLPAGIALWGACARDTVLTSSLLHSQDGVVTVTGADTELRGLRIGPSRRPGVWMNGADKSVRLEAVLVEGVEGLGVVVLTRATLDAAELVISGTGPRSTDGMPGVGLTLQFGAEADVGRVALLDNPRSGVAVSDAGSTLRLSDARIGGSAAGRAMVIQGSAQGTIARTILGENRLSGMLVVGAGTRAEIADSSVRDTLPDATTPNSGRGLEANDGAAFDVIRTRVERNHAIGVTASNTGTVMTLSHVIVSDTRGDAAGPSAGRGVSIGHEATATLDHTLLSRNHSYGFFAGGGSSVVVSDFLVRDTTGRGAELTRGTRAQLDRVVIERNRSVGVLALEGGTDVVMSDAVVRDTESDSADGRLGRGVQMQSGALVELNRILADGNRETGLSAAGTAVVSVTDAEVVRTRLNECAVDGRCADLQFGMGIGSYVGASLSLERFSIRGSATCGVHLALDGELDLDDGEITDSPIGACLQVEDYDLSRLTDSVYYRDNGVNLETTRLPTPDLLESATP